MADSTESMTRWQNVRSGLVIGLLVACLVLFLGISGAFAQVRLQLSNVYYVPSALSDKVVIIGLDNASLEKFGRSPLEWPRTLYAELVEKLSDARARVIAFDILFAQPTAGDAEFAQAIRDARSSDSRTRTVMPLVGGQTLTPRSGAQTQSIYFKDVLSPVNALASEADYLGYVNTFADVDGVVRRQVSQVSVNDSQGLSFPYAIYLAYLRIPVSSLSDVVSSNDGFMQVASGSIVPVDHNGLWLQNYFGQPDASFSTVSMRAVLENAVDPAIFLDKIVLVGLTSTGAVDRYLTPTSVSGQMMSGIEIYAHAMETLIQGAALAEQSPLSQIAMIIILAIATSLIYAHLRWQQMLLVAVMVIFVWVLVVFAVFSLRREVVNLFHSSLAITLPVIFNIGWSITTEVNRRRRTEFLLDSVVHVSEQQMSMDRILPLIVEDIRCNLPVFDVAVQVGDRRSSLNGQASGSPIWALVLSAVTHGKSVVNDVGAAVPIIWQGRTLGALAVELASPARASNVSLELLQTVGRQIAPGLENAILHNRTQYQNMRLETILADSPTGIMILDEKLQIKKINAFAELIFGTNSARYSGGDFIQILENSGIDIKKVKSIQEYFESRTLFREELLLNSKTLILDAAPLSSIAEWVLVMNDVSAIAELSQLKTRMIRIASHDLKNPLARVLGYMQLFMGMNPALSEKQNYYLEQITKAGKEMHQIIDDILNLEQLRSGATKFVLVDMQRLLQEVIQQHRQDMIIKQQTFKSNIPDNLPKIIADPVQLTQAITNLFGNAVKYSPDGGRIELYASCTENNLLLKIEDNGYGIPEAAQSRLFEEFYRVRREATMNIPGTGLGLSLVKSIVEAHHGRVWVKSAENVGSTFFVEIPIEQEPVVSDVFPSVLAGPS